MSGSSQQLTLMKGAPRDQVWDLLCVQLTSYLEGGQLMWMMPLLLHDNQKSDYNMLMMAPPNVLQGINTWDGMYTFVSSDLASSAEIVSKIDVSSVSYQESHHV